MAKVGMSPRTRRTGPMVAAMIGVAVVGLTSLSVVGVAALVNQDDGGGVRQISLSALRAQEQNRLQEARKAREGVVPTSVPTMAVAQAPTAQPSKTARPTATTSKPAPTGSVTQKPKPTASPTAPKPGMDADIAALQANPEPYAKVLVAANGWDERQGECLSQLWTGVSGWKWNYSSAKTGAYGIAGASPGDKMASVAADWKTNPATQMTWGVQYIKQRHGTPCQAKAHKTQHGWY